MWRDPAEAVALARQGQRADRGGRQARVDGEDSPTRFKGKPGVDKRVAWADPLPLEEVKTIGRALGASVNDLLLSCVAGALRDYLVERGDAVDALIDPRARAGQPAADREGVQARQPVRAGVPRSADRHRESRSSAFMRCAKTCAR